jgi:hypothetical protein
MLTLEPGPLALLDLSQLVPVPDSPGFERLVTPAVETVTSAHDGVTSVQRRVGAALVSDLDADHQATIGQARAAYDAEATAPGSASGDPLLDHGESGDVIRQSVLRYLPDPQSAIEFPFTAPPAPPDGLALPAPPDIQTMTARVDALERSVRALGGSVGGGAGTTGGGGGGGGGGPDVAAIRAAIRGFYLTYFGREPDVSGWDYYTSAILAGNSLTALENSFIATRDAWEASHPGWHPGDPNGP